MVNAAENRIMNLSLYSIFKAFGDSNFSWEIIKNSTGINNIFMLS